MSFRTAREVVATYLDCFQKAEGWCDQLPDGAEYPERSAALKLVRQELKTRRLRFLAAIETGRENALATFLQYDPTDDLQEALDELKKTVPNTPNELFDAIADFYRSIHEALEDNVRIVESTPAVDLFGQLSEELEAAISSQAWKMRVE